jgi:hypothetical protein
VVEERVLKEMPKRLPDAYIKQHTRRGIRSGCDCNWCLEKKVGTSFIGRTSTPWWRWDELKDRLVPWYKEMDYDEIGEFLVKWERERKRNIVRERLKIAKEEIL